MSELAKLGARLIIQRAVEDEFDAWLGRARYERRPEYQRGLRNDEAGMRNGFRPRHVQTAEGELEIEIPQVREAAEPFVSSLFPRARKLIATEPLRAMVIGAFVRGLSMRDVESLCEKAGLGKVAKSTAQRICTELRERFEQFKRRDLYDIRLVALFLDATFLAVRPDGPKEGVLIAWAFTDASDRVPCASFRSVSEREQPLPLGSVLRHLSRDRSRDRRQGPPTDSREAVIHHASQPRSKPAAFRPEASTSPASHAPTMHAPRLRAAVTPCWAAAASIACGS